jgi:hypothetical protein
MASSTAETTADATRWALELGVSTEPPKGPWTVRLKDELSDTA